KSPTSCSCKTIGAIWLLVLLIKDGTIGENQYGPDPNNPAIFDFENQEI
ncbi:MAG: hypothetical protein RLZZ118_2072, partial [Bacteroidota bacterium]